MKTYTEFLEEAFKRTGKRVRFSIMHHGSDKNSVNSIKKTGPRPSPTGSEGPGHYVTPHRKKASKYAEFTSRQRGEEPGVVSYRVPTSRINQVSDIPKGLTGKKKATRETPVVQNTRTGHVVMDPEYANRKMIRNPSPTIRKR